MEAVLGLLAALTPNDDPFGGLHCCTAGWTSPLDFDVLPVEELGLPVRLYNLLKRAGLHSIGDLREARGPQMAETVPNLTPEGLATLEGALARAETERDMS